MIDVGIFRSAKHRLKGGDFKGGDCFCLGYLLNSNSMANSQGRKYAAKTASQKFQRINSV